MKLFSSRKFDDEANYYSDAFRDAAISSKYELLPSALHVRNCPILLTQGFFCRAYYLVAVQKTV